MFSGRMLSVVRYLSISQKTTYKEAAAALKMSERSIRYDVDRINDALSLEKLPVIEKGSKGVLVYPKDLDISMLEEESEVVYTGKERISILLLILMMRNEDLKINQLSELFKVSRSTIKNDMAALEEELKKEGLSIEYSDHFYLAGPRKKRTSLLNQEFKKYINYLINPFTNYNSYEFYCIHIIHKAFEGISIPNVVLAVNALLEELKCTLTQASYSWYMSNIMAVIWFIIHNKEYPLDLPVETEYDKDKFDRFSEKLEQILGMPVGENNIRLMAKLFDFTNKFAGLNGNVDLLRAESVTFSLISGMSKELDMPLDKDKTLLEGLLNHMVPLLQRIENHIDIRDNMMQLMGEEEKKLYGVLAKVCKELDVLCEITSEDELVYLTICFMASIKRMKGAPYKRVLLVCGHGYGTTTMLKESLLSEYQLHIIDTIPLYKITSYPDWAAIDYVLTTVKLNNKLPKPCILLNPILQLEDRAALDKLGIPRKMILSSYYSIEEKLTFLDETNRRRVMEVIEKELGYQTVKSVNRSKNFTNFLKFDCIRLVDLKLSWRQAVIQSGRLLQDRSFIEESYVQNTIDFIEEQGFYAVSDGAFALLHGKGNEGIRRTGISLLVNKHPVQFGDKSVRVVFFLASRDSKEHIPAVVTLVRMVKTTPLIRELERCRSEEEIYQTILRYEFEVS